MSPATAVGLPTLLASRSAAAHHLAPLAARHGEDSVGAGEAKALRVRNTFIDIAVQRSPSLERFCSEREVSTCPASQVGKLRKAFVELVLDEDGEGAAAPEAARLDGAQQHRPAAADGADAQVASAAAPQPTPALATAPVWSLSSLRPGAPPFECSVFTSRQSSGAAPVTVMDPQEHLAVLSLSEAIGAQGRLARGATFGVDAELGGGAATPWTWGGASLAGGQLCVPAQRSYPAGPGTLPICPVTPSYTALPAGPIAWAPPQRLGDQVHGALQPGPVHPPPPPPPAEPAPGTAELPSVGSAKHKEGLCKPCAFIHSARCANGLSCQFCHLCDADEKRRRKKERMEAGQSVPVERPRPAGKGSRRVG